MQGRYDPVPLETREKIREMVAEGHPYREVAAAIGYSTGVVYKYGRDVQRRKRLRGQRLLKEEVAWIERMAKEGRSAAEIATATGVAKRTVENWVYRLGLSRKLKDWRKEALEAYNSRKFKSRRQIARHLGAPVHAIEKALQGLPPCRPWYYDQKVVAEIVRIFSTGAFTKEEVAAKLGVPRSFVHVHTIGMFHAGGREERHDPWLKEFYNDTARAA